MPDQTQNQQEDPRTIARENIENREQEVRSEAAGGFWGMTGSGNIKKKIQQGSVSVRDIIAPASISITPNYLQLDSYFIKTLFVFTYPRYIETNWLSPIINYDMTMDIGMYIHPMENKDVMTTLKNQVGKLESTVMIEQEKGAPRDPEIETALGDIEALRDILQRGEMRLFQFGLYFTIYAKSVEELKTLTDQLESTLGGLLIYTNLS